jgi:uncharacterized phiE125 gp8 family phage protein
MTYSCRIALPRVLVIEPPAPLLTATEVRARLGISDDDAVLSPLIKAVCAQIEPPAGWVGVAFAPQTLEQRSEWFADHWGGSFAKLRFPPLRTVESVKYVDTAGAEQTLDPASYEVLTATGQLVLAHGGAWPSVRSGIEAVRIRFTAGYDYDDPQLDAAKSAVALAVRSLRSLSARDLAISSETVPGVGSRNYLVTGAASQVISGAVDGLLQGYRVYS